jgi:large exoprotein involved in heme utilization and adhesion
VSSEFGTQGEVQINSVNEPKSTLTQLPENVVDYSKLITQNACQKISDSEFSITGRGGKPLAPSETFSGDVVWSDTRPLGLLSQAETTRNLTQTQNLIPNVEPAPIISATGWLFNDKGEVTLITHTSNMTSGSFKAYPASCSKR